MDGEYSWYNTSMRETVRETSVLETRVHGLKFREQADSKQTFKRKRSAKNILAGNYSLGTVTLKGSYVIDNLGNKQYARNKVVGNIYAGNLGSI